MEDGRHGTLDVPCQESNGRMRKGNAPAVMGIQYRAALKGYGRCKGISKRMGPSTCCATASDANRGSWPLSCPEPDFAFALVFAGVRDSDDEPLSTRGCSGGGSSPE